MRFLRRSHRCQLSQSPVGKQISGSTACCSRIASQAGREEAAAVVNVSKTSMFMKNGAKNSTRGSLGVLGGQRVKGIDGCSVVSRPSARSRPRAEWQQ